MRDYQGDWQGYAHVVAERHFPTVAVAQMLEDNLLGVDFLLFRAAFGFFRLRLGTHAGLVRNQRQRGGEQHGQQEGK